MKKKIIILLLALFTTFSFCACGGGKQENSESNGKIRVSVTFNAMAEFAKAVGKDKVAVTAIIPDGTEPHDFEPKARDLAELGEADVFVYNGLGMEAWAEKAAKAAGNQKLITVEASKSIDPIQNTGTDEIKEHGQYDPHVWIGVKGAETEAKNIRDGLIQSSPADKDYFMKNCDSFVSQLESLYSEYRTKFQTVKNKSFVTGHAAFAYLCRDFDLTQNSVEDVFAEGEPSARKLTELVDYCKKNNVKTVFVEDMVSPAVSQTLAKQVGAKAEKIYTMESGEDGKNYLDRARENLQKIDESLS